MTFEEEFNPDVLLKKHVGTCPPTKSPRPKVVCLGVNKELDKYKQRVREVVTAYLDKRTCEKEEKIRKYRDGILKELGL